MAIIKILLLFVIDKYL